MPDIVVLDPGHGGCDPQGASSPNHATGPNGLLEKDLTLDMALRVRNLLDGPRVVLTREGATNLTLSERAATAKRNHAAAFVSLHWNGSPDQATDGTEAWVARHANQRSRRLAKVLVDRISVITGATNRGVRERDLGVLLPERHNPETGACLIEIAFLSNPTQARRLQTEEYRNRLAGELAEGIRISLQDPLPPVTALKNPFKPANHFFVKKTCDCTAKTCTAATTVSVMNPSEMRPCFIEASGNVKTASSLQTALVNLLHTDRYKDFVRATAATAAKDTPVPCKFDSTNQVAVAVVDLTGPSKLAAPELGEWCSTAPVEGGSSNKILAIYALHQLRFDLQHLVDSQNIKTKADLDNAVAAHWKGAAWSQPPKIGQLFKVTDRRPANIKLDFADWVSADPAPCGGFEVDDDCDESKLIMTLGFEYIGSVAMQSGLRHPNLGGIWLGSSYGGGGCKAAWWADSPIDPIPSCSGTRTSGHHLTALSAATYYTLAAQGRLADDSTSRAILNRLECGCGLSPGFLEGLGELPHWACCNSVLKTEQKCGVIDNCRHETMLIERDCLRYVVVLLSTNKFFPFKLFIKDVDAIIDGRNPCPPPKASPAKAKEWAPEAGESRSLDIDVSLLSDHSSGASLQEIAGGGQGNAPQDIREAILKRGEANADDLADRIFWGHHTDLPRHLLDLKNPKDRDLIAEWGQIKRRQVIPLIWLRQLILLIDKYRGDLPREFLLGWIANESDGKVRIPDLGEIRWSRS